MTTDARAIFGRFAKPGEVISVEPLPGGHINDSFRVSLRRGGHVTRLLLQRINGEVFPDPQAVMENITRVAAHLAASLEAEGISDLERRVLVPLPAADGRGYVMDAGGSCWRLYPFIEGIRTILSVTTPAEAEAGGRAFGEYQRRLADLPGPRLVETIVRFHDTPLRFAALERAVAEDSHDRVGSAGVEIDYALEQRGTAAVLLDAHRTGTVPERVVHNDAKISNVLLDQQTGEGLCVVDLDTVMPGLSLFDFGDMVRTMTSPAAEDAGDPAGAEVSLSLFRALAGGYLAEMGPLLTPGERALLVTSGRLITLEIGVRFLTDYLCGDNYFHTDHPEQNLHRCRVQFAHHRSQVLAAPELERLVKIA